VAGEKGSKSGGGLLYNDLLVISYNYTRFLRDSKPVEDICITIHFLISSS
jgi:hypothetical protein